MTVIELMRELINCDPNTEITFRVGNLETNDATVKETNGIAYKQVYITLD